MKNVAMTRRIFVAVRESGYGMLINCSKTWYSTTATPSLSRLSPNTMMYSVTLTLISSKTAMTATGSTAEMIDENSKNTSGL